MQGTLFYPGTAGGVNWGALPLGLPSLGGPIATASGLVFIGAAMDEYRLREDGRQYLVIAAGDTGPSAREGDWLLAFALPESESRR